MTHKLEHTAAGLMMLAVMATGAWQAIGALKTGFTENISGSFADFRAGKSTEQFSTQLDRKLPARDTLIGFANLGRYWLLRGAGEEVRIGSQGWLFSSEEVQYFKTGEEQTAQRVQLLKQVQARLAADQVHLVVALVPDKSRVQFEHTWLGTYPQWNQERYAGILQSIRASGIPVADLLTPLQAAVAAGKIVYYRTDTHWNQLGAEIAAQEIASTIQSLTVNLPKTEFLTEQASTPTLRPGDLARMIGQTTLPDSITLGKDVENIASTRKVSSSDGQGLFGDSIPPVTLTGSSYSLRANFHGFLQQALQTEVLNVARDGGGFFQATRAYLDDEAFKESPPNVVIWEIPERMFPKPLTEEERSFK